MIDFRIICMFVLGAIVVAIGVKKWCSRTARRTNTPVASPGMEWKMEIIDGKVYVEMAGLISNLKGICEIVEESQSGHK